MKLENNLKHNDKNSRRKAFNFEGLKSFLYQIPIETIEFSLSLIILSEINKTTGLKTNILKSEDLLITALVYSIFSLKSEIVSWTNDKKILPKSQATKSTRVNQNLRSLTLLSFIIIIIYLILQIISFRSSREINFNLIYFFICFFIFIKSFNDSANKLDYDLLEFTYNKYHHAYMFIKKKINETGNDNSKKIEEIKKIMDEDL